MKISKLKISLPTSGHCYRIGSRVSSKLLMATRVHPFFCHKNKMSNIYTVIFGPISGIVCKVAALSPNRSPPSKKMPNFAVGSHYFHIWFVPPPLRVYPPPK